MPFWQFFRQGRDCRALLVQLSRIPHGISKILFALGADDFLALLEGKIKECHLFKVQSGKTTVCCFNMRHLVLNELLLIIFNVVKE